MEERDSQRIHRDLRDRALRLDLRPGEVLDEARLAEELGVSRTPIREAIINLIAEGLVVRDGRKAKIAPLDFDKIPDLFEALLVSSRLVQRLAAERRRQTDLQQIHQTMLAFEDAVEQGDGTRRSDLNLQFHKAISTAAQNAYFSSFYEEALHASVRLARACFAAPDTEQKKADLNAHLRETMAQHRQIYAAIENQDITLADQLAETHFQLTKTRLETVLFAGGSAVEIGFHLP